MTENNKNFTETEKKAPQKEGQNKRFGRPFASKKQNIPQERPQQTQENAGRDNERMDKISAFLAPSPARFQNKDMKNTVKNEETNKERTPRYSGQNQRRKPNNTPKSVPNNTPINETNNPANNAQNKTAKMPQPRNARPAQDNKKTNRNVKTSEKERKSFAQTKKAPSKNTVKTGGANKEKLPDNVIRPQENKPKPIKKTGSKLRVMMLGGLQEIGKNIAVIEYEKDIIVVDCGMGFPDDEMLGIDLVVPDFAYLEENADRVRGVFLTHGHEDHVGGIPYLLRHLNPPIYGTRLTLGIVKNRLQEFKLEKKTNLVTVQAGDRVKAGAFTVEFIHVNHSIADASCLAIKTPVGMIVHSGDFKLDVSPIDGQMMDLARLGQIGNEGVLFFMCESTNAERPGYTLSERKVGGTLEHIFRTYTNNRLVIATFSSNVHRVQQIIDASVRHNRRVVVTGRSMLNVVSAAVELGYMHVPDGTLIDITKMKNYPPEQITIITTGSQGEPMSALSRMAFSEHDRIKLTANDVVVLSAGAIPGNEKLVGKIINALIKGGVKVISDQSLAVHVSGHACQEELKLFHALMKPKFFMPIHGEYRHLHAHKEVAEYLGMPSQNIFISEIGRVIELDEDSAKFAGHVPSGNVLVDGSGVGDVGSVVLRDRRNLSQDGIFVVVATVDSMDGTVLSGPDIVSRGFVYVKESEEMLEGAKKVTKKALEKAFTQGNADWLQLKTAVKDELSKYLFQKTKRRPMVLPVIMTLS